MGAVMGKDAVFKLDISAGTLTDITAYLTSVDGLPGGVETDDTTTMGDSARESIPGLKDAAKVSIEGNFSPTANEIDTYLGTLYGNGGKLASGGSISFEWHPNGTASGNPKYTGECWLTNYVVSAQVGSKVPFKAELQVTGGATRGTN